MASKLWRGVGIAAGVAVFGCLVGGCIGASSDPPRFKPKTDPTPIDPAVIMRFAGTWQLSYEPAGLCSLPNPLTQLFTITVDPDGTLIVDGTYPAPATAGTRTMSFVDNNTGIRVVTTANAPARVDDITFYVQPDGSVMGFGTITKAGCTDQVAVTGARVA
jgi:hypothetical protein